MATKKQTTSYTDLLNDFNKFQDRDTATAVGLQSALAIGNIFKGKRAAEMLKYTPPARMQARTVNLSTPDLASGATRALDRAFASSVNAAREAGRTVGGDLLDAYGRNTREIADAQGKAYQQTQNKAEELNFQAGSQADAYNFQQSAQDAQIEAALRGKKSGIYSNTTDQTMEMIANTINLRNAATLNKFQAGVDLKPYMDAEAAAKAASDKAIQDAEEEAAQANAEAKAEAAGMTIEQISQLGLAAIGLGEPSPKDRGKAIVSSSFGSEFSGENKPQTFGGYANPKGFDTGDPTLASSAVPDFYSRRERQYNAETPSLYEDDSGFNTGDNVRTKSVDLVPFEGAKGFSANAPAFSQKGVMKKFEDIKKERDWYSNQNPFIQAGSGLFGANVYGLQGPTYNFPARSSYKGATNKNTGKLRNPRIASVMEWISSF